MKARHFILSLSFIFSLFLLTPMTGFAQPRGRVVAIDNSLLVAMVHPSIDDCTAIQEKDNWCWAACLQMVTRYYSIPQSQSQIVSRVFGSAENWTASANEIYRGINGWSGLSVKRFSTKSAQSIADELIKGHPLIVGLEEHAYLLTHLFFTRGADGSSKPYKVVLINPRNGREETKDWERFINSVNTLVSVYR